MGESPAALQSQSGCTTSLARREDGVSSASREGWDGDLVSPELDRESIQCFSAAIPGRRLGLYMLLH